MAQVHEIRRVRQYNGYWVVEILSAATGRWIVQSIQVRHFGTNRPQKLGVAPYPHTSRDSGELVMKDDVIVPAQRYARMLLADNIKRAALRAIIEAYKNDDLLLLKKAMELAELAVKD